MDGITPEAVLLEFGLPAQAVTGIHTGFGNRAYLTQDYVIRVARNEHQHHDRECRIALAMLRAGVRTARPLGWQRTYSVLERVPGAPIGRGGTASDGVWNALLDDLERVWANPLEPVPELPKWSADRDVFAVNTDLTRTELEQVHFILNTPRSIRQPAFVHGDAFGENVMVADGQYQALIDWGCAGPQPLEYEFSRLPHRAFEVALERHAARLDLPLLYALRLDISFVVATFGYMDWNEVRTVLRLALEHDEP